jgi:hypothetical protein
MIWNKNNYRTKLRDNLPNRFQIGSKLVPNWFQIGSELVLNWFRIGSKLVPSWFQLSNLELVILRIRQIDGLRQAPNAIVLSVQISK